MINKAAENRILEKSQEKRREYISDEAFKRILEKGRLKKEGKLEEFEKEI